MLNKDKSNEDGVDTSKSMEGSMDKVSSAENQENVDAPVIEISDDGSWDMRRPEAATSPVLEAVAQLRDTLMASNCEKVDDHTPEDTGPKEVVYDSILENKKKTKSYWEQRMLEGAPKVVDAVAKSPTVAKIALELREMREREEELRRARLALQQLPLHDSCSEYGSEDSSMVSPPGFTHQRTDSMSSGHSSGSEFGRRRVTVKPLEEPEAENETPTYMRLQKETPIEREIRLAREREEELRREKGLPPLNGSPVKSEFRFASIQKALTSNERQTVEPQPVTNRIQQEISEITEREKELKASIVVKTPTECEDDKTSEIPNGGECTIEEKDKVQNSVPQVAVPVHTGINSETSTPLPVKPPTPLFTSAPVSPVFTSSPQRFSTSGGQKGLMQRFYASHGRMKVISPRPVISPSAHTVLPTHSQPPIQRKPIEISPINDIQDSDEEPPKTPMRRGYQSAEEKIQAELQEMQKREEELRLLRAKLFAHSQPNLLSIGSNDDDELPHMNGDTEKRVLQSAHSNPNLLDSEDSLDGSQDSSTEKFQRNAVRKRSALIAEWESRIQKNSEQ